MSEFQVDLSLYSGLKRVALLKKLDVDSGEAFRSKVLAKESPEMQPKIEKVVFRSDMSGIPEFSEEWFHLIRAKMQRMEICRQYCSAAMSLGDDTGFTEFERELILGSCKISSLYGPYYFAYLEAVQDPSIVAKLQSSPPSPTSESDCYSHYTIVKHSDSGGYSTVSFAAHFSEVLSPIIDAMDALVTKLEAVAGRTAVTDDLRSEYAAYIAFFKQYRLCHSSDLSAKELEEHWSELDRKWMDMKGNIQIVHDIETGYGDPLRMKATPDFSLRFLDDTYAKENTTIREIQNHMENYFKNRDTRIARDGLTALTNTLAGIYYIPFKTGISLQFSFSGQSIPNRENIKVEKGVKIYFDAVETEARVELNKDLIRKVFHDPAGVIEKYKPEAVEQLVWHVAAHEVGHAIYNLDAVAADVNLPGVTTLLEEPRAELTAMFTLMLLFEKGMLSRPHLEKSLAHFALDALRYFNKFNSAPLRPYMIFMIYAFRIYNETGYLQCNESGDVIFDDSKVLDVLKIFQSRFLEILDCEDALDGAGLQVILDDMSQETEFVKRVVERVLPK